MGGSTVLQLHPPAPGEVISSPARRARRLAGVLLVPLATVLVVAAAVTVRIRYLDAQSYWTDEIFSVNQARVDVARVLEVGATEVHTPLYALLLHGWITLGGGNTTTAWTHALSGLFGLLGIAASWTGLRRTGLTSRARWVAVGVVAANGFAIVYAQESRAYGLALLGAIGVTAATASVTAALLDHRRPRWELWVCWAMLAATAHLLGAVLVGVAGAVLIAVALAVHRWRQALLAAPVVVLALGPQLAWILVHGRNQPGFAGGTQWISPPGPQEALDLLTSTFAAGNLVTTAGGYVWRSTTGLVVAAALLVLALLAAAAGTVVATVRSRTSTAPDGDSSGSTRAAEATVDPAGPAPLFAEEPRRDTVLALLLLVLAGLTGAATYVVSQSVHVWTLRNVIVVVPALLWGVAWLVCAAPPWRRVREVAAVAVLAASAAALVPISANLDRPYKTDFRGALLYLARMRAEQPQATFSFFGGGGPISALVAADLPLSDLRLINIWDKVDPHRRALWAIPTLRRIPGPQAALFYTGVTGADDAVVAAQILQQLGDPDCERVPLHGIVLVACRGDGPSDVPGVRR